MIRHALHKIHLWLGIALCVPLVLQGLTGSMLVFERSIYKPSLTLANGTPHSVGEIIEAARAAVPEEFEPAMFRSGSTNEYASVFFSKQSHKKTSDGRQGKRVRIQVDPVSLQIIHEEDSGFMHAVEDWHTNLMLREYGGRSIVGWFGVAMLVFGISGIVLWWPRHGQWKRAFTVRLGVPGFLLHRDLHGAAGIWSVLMLITVSFSGVYLAFPKTMDAMIGSVAVLRDFKAPPAQKLEPLEDQEPMNVDEVAALAIQSVPESRLVSINLPGRLNQPYRVGLLKAGARAGEPVITVFIDPWQKRVMEIRNPQEYTIAEQFVVWQHAIHTSEGFGVLWRTLVFLTGFMPLLFAITGVSMWLIKGRRKAGRV
ncbi:MAG TPA: PepSY-associated TM helix domain-containing protein [Rickettsiales bacterium]|nr:PepSY-associated TM helix domain-containing protein [Rickettsiales bacterium]